MMIFKRLLETKTILINASYYDTLKFIDLSSTLRDLSPMRDFIIMHWSFGKYCFIQLFTSSNSWPIPLHNF